MANIICSTGSFETTGGNVALPNLDSFGAIRITGALSQNLVIALPWSHNATEQIVVNLSTGGTVQVRFGAGQASNIPSGAAAIVGNGWSCSMGGGAQQQTVEAFPIGSIFYSAVATNPATLLGYGTWQQIAEGRVIVGVDAGDSDFNVAGKEGGAKTHTLSEAEMPPHVHDEYTNGASTGGLVGWAARDTSTNTPTITGYDTGSTGGGAAHNNLQPYHVAFIWQRTG